jgi:hypothetical protein
VSSQQTDLAGSSVPPPTPSVHSTAGAASSSVPISSVSGAIGAFNEKDVNSEAEVDESEEESSEEESSDEEEEEEPKLKYQRLGASVTALVKKDAAKVLVPYEKFLLLGTISGRLLMMDLNGNEILSFQPHTAAITDLSLDTDGQYVASGSEDGTVVITNLFTKESVRHAYARPVHAVALPGDYTNKVMFAAGVADGRFIINTKGWFSTKDNVIHAGEGPITSVKWRRELLAWANDAGVKVYDVSTSERISIIEGTGENGQPPPSAELYKCHLCWSKDDTLLIGWADCVKVGVVKPNAVAMKPRTRGPGQIGGPMITSSTRFVQIVATFKTEYIICGIAPWGDQHLVLMAFLENEGQRASGNMKQ